MIERSIEFWAALIGAAIYVYLNSKEKRLVPRIFIVASSAMLGFSLTPDVTAYLGIGEVLAGVGVTVFGYTIIDVLTSVLADRAFLKDLLLRRLK